MLPSTGYFKGINCPYFENGLCERPYCHFRHARKDFHTSERIESGATPNNKITTAAVQKVLQEAEPSSQSTLDATTNSCLTNNSKTITKVTYNPTPISELNKINNTDGDSNEEINDQKKKHIPVPYTPRKPASLPIKRLVEDEEQIKPFIYNPLPAKYTPGSVESSKIDPYFPKGTVGLSKKYLPGSEVELQEYKPKETHSTNKVNYTPSSKNVSNKKSFLEYKPIKVSSCNSNKKNFIYQPTPRELVPCFSSDEEEPDLKKMKFSDNLKHLDDLEPEFNILDQILDEENNIEDLKCKSKVKEINNCTEESVGSNSNSCDRKHGEKRQNKDIKEKYNDLKSKSAKVNEINNCNPKNTDIKTGTVSNEKKEYSKKRLNKEGKSVKSEENHKIDKKKDFARENKKCSNDSRNSEKQSHHKKSKAESRKEDKAKRSSLEDHKHSKSNSSEKRTSEKSSKDYDKKHKKEKHKREYSDERKGENNTKSSYKSKSVKEPKEKSKEKRNDSERDKIIDLEIYPESEELLEDSDEESIALECKKIFEEYVPTEKFEHVQENIVISEDKYDDNSYVPSKKRISRAADKNIQTKPKPRVKPDFKVSAAQAMTERLNKIKEFHASRNSSSCKINQNLDTSKITMSTNASTSKIRIAHVPYASTLINAKKNISSSTVSKSETSSSTTVIQTVKKGAQRVAHIPSDKFIDRPGVLEPLASKIPANIRSTYLNMMIDECLKIYISATDAYARAQHEELTTSKKCSTVQIYKNSAVLTVSRLRKELQECNGVKRSGIDCHSLQKFPQAVTSNANTSASWSIEIKNRRLSDNIKEFSGANFYNNIKKWILTEEQLQENGFPRLHPSGEKGRAIIYGQNKKIPPKGLVRTCCRCKKDYTVDKKGFAVVQQECIYHPNNKYRVRGEVRYQCCSQDGTSDGCCIAPSHVYEYVDFENLKGFVKTLPPEDNVGDYGVYSLDCEMCYTTQGLDLTRVTVINSNCKVIYETFIKPLHPIIDYNTRYSGISEEQMANVKTTLLDVQATLLTMFNSKSILIGHSLESDFKVLKLIHDTVIDTSVLFPHKMGPPYKRALRNLSSEHLKKIIQNSVDGHDSAEDARVCMELLHYKLKEELKTR